MYAKLTRVWTKVMRKTGVRKYMCQHTFSDPCLSHHFRSPPSTDNATVSQFFSQVPGSMFFRTLRTRSLGLGFCGPPERHGEPQRWEKEIILVNVDLQMIVVRETVW